ncbi:MAG: PEP-CTERM sorting domain-containing protein [Opitutales bacterium]
MKDLKTTSAVFAAFLVLGAVSASAQVVVSTTTQSANAGTSVVSVVNNDGTPAANSAVSPNQIGNADGSAFSGGSLSTTVDSAFFTFTVDAFNGYDDPTTTGNGFNEYIDGLTSTSTSYWNSGGWGANDTSIGETAGDRFRMASSNGEGLRFTLSDISVDHSVTLSAIEFNAFVGETADVVFYDSDTDTVISSAAITTDFAGDITLTENDFFVVANDTNGSFYVDNFTVDLVAVPEPSAYVLIAGLVGFAGVMLRRRK